MNRPSRVRLSSCHAEVDHLSSSLRADFLSSQKLLAAILSQNKSIMQVLAANTLLGAPNELFFKKKLFYSGYFAGKTDSLLYLAGKMKYICWQTI